MGMEETSQQEATPQESFSEKTEITVPAESTTANPAGCDSHEKELPASTPIPAPKKKNAVYPALAATLSTTDITIERLNRLLSTSGGLETVLSTADYSASTLHHLLSSRAALILFTRLNLRSRKQNHSTAPPSPLLSLSTLISETRTTTRLFGLVPLWTWGSSTFRNSSQNHDPLLFSITLLQVFVNVVYQAMENVAFLAEKGVVSKRWVEKWGIGGIGRWYIWSTRAWLGHVLLEFVRLARERGLRLKREEEERRKGEGKDEEGRRVARERELLSWKKSLVSNLCWAPLCVHWSLEKGVGVPEELTGFISLLAGLWELRDSWRNTAF